MNSEYCQVSWYAIRVKPQCEWKVGAGFAARGLEAFLPTQKKPVTPRSRRDVTPLFPGYVFCRFDASHTLRVLTTPGVLHVLSVGNTPAPVEQQEIFNLQTLCSLSVSVAPCSKYEAGQQILITSGPLKDVSGAVVHDNGKTRLLVSVSLLRRTVRCEIKREWVERPTGSSLPELAAAGRLSF